MTRGLRVGAEGFPPQPFGHASRTVVIDERALADGISVATAEPS
jgi:hypothetical protein